MVYRRRKYGRRGRRRRFIRRRRLRLSSFRSYTKSRPADFLPRRLVASAQFTITIPQGSQFSSVMAFPCFASQFVNTQDQQLTGRFIPIRRSDPIIHSLQMIAGGQSGSHRGLDPTTGVTPNIFWESEFDNLRTQYDKFRIAAARSTFTCYAAQLSTDFVPYHVHGMSDPKHDVTGTIYLGTGADFNNRLQNVVEDDSRVLPDTIIRSSNVRSARRTNNQQGRLWLSSRPQGAGEKIDWHDTDFNCVDLYALLNQGGPTIYPFTKATPSFNPCFYYVLELPYIASAVTYFRCTVQIEAICFFRGSKPVSRVRPIPAHAVLQGGEDWAFTDPADWQYQPWPEDEGGVVLVGDPVTTMARNVLRLDEDFRAPQSQSAGIGTSSLEAGPMLSQASIDKLAEQVAQKIVDGTMNCQGPTTSPS